MIKKFLGIFLLVVSLSCSCYANSVDNGRTNDIKASVNLCNSDTQCLDEDRNMLLPLAVMAGKDDVKIYPKVLYPLWMR